MRGIWVFLCVRKYIRFFWNSVMKKNVLITGGAGFIGRWVVKAFLDDTPHRVYVLDDFSNGLRENLAEFANEPRLAEVKKGSIRQRKMVGGLVAKIKPDICLHLAAQIVVQDSIDDPVRTFESDVDGTFYLLEACRAAGTKFVFMSTCMVYDLSKPEGAIDETHPVLPRSPYAGAKLAGENMTISYYHAYGMPTAVLRPFNTYGPHQKATGEGGVVSIFLTRQIRGEDLLIYGTGHQTRDLLYVEDCADFLLRASTSGKVWGRTLNAATGSDITINKLARTVVDSAPDKTGSKIRRIKHIHPQSEIMKLCGDSSAAQKVLGWRPRVDIEDGLGRTRKWLEKLIAEKNSKWL